MDTVIYNIYIYSVCVRGRESVYLCVREKECACVCVYVCVCVCVRGRENVCM